MSYNWSDQQLAIFEEFLNPTAKVLAIQAVAGAAKSSSLVEATARYKQANPSATIRYLIFGNKPASDAKIEFGVNAIVSTLHSFAYHYVYAQYGLGQVKQFLTWHDLPQTPKRPFGKDQAILQLIENYCTSKYTNIDEYVTAQDNDFEYSLVPHAKHLMSLMARGQLAITHSFYLKFFHVLVKRDIIKLPFVDKLLVDEAQDLSAITLDIIEAIPTNHLVIVGDQNQRIFEFLDLENGFKRFSDAKILTLTKSFRVDNKYAPAIQGFLHTHLDPEADFIGMQYQSNPVIRTKAYLTRNNATLIGKMIEFNKLHTPYNLASSAKLNQIFKLPLALIYAKPGHVQRDHELKHLQYDIDEYFKLPAKFRETQSLFKYLLSMDDVQSSLKSAITLILKFGSEDIIEAYEHAKEHKGNKHQLSLLTAHTSKGATFDEVTLDNDLNEAIDDIISGRFRGSDDDARAEKCLYFVACTRHRHTLTNAKHLQLEEI